MAAISTTPWRPSTSVRLCASGASNTYRAHLRQPLHSRLSSTLPAAPQRAPLALFFPGHGVQRVGMATPWLEAFPKTCKPFLQEMDDILGQPLSDTILNGPNSTLNKTPNTQPAIMAVSIMILRILEQDFGFKTTEKVDVVLGHSLGEFAALVAGGYLKYTDALKIIRKRGEAMEKCTTTAEASGKNGDYGMVALICEPDRLADLITDIEEYLNPATNTSDGSEHGMKGHSSTAQPVNIANINSRNQIVLSGSIERIDSLLAHVRQFGGHDPRKVRINSQSPFHSPLMLEAKETMSKILAKTDVEFPGNFPCISNVSALPFKSRDDLKDLLARQCTETVRWWDSIRYVDQEMRVRRWVGVGPGKVGRNLVGKEVGMRGKDTIKGGGVWGISRPEEIEEFLRGLEETEILDEDDENINPNYRED